jgi:hypothetical protein
MNKKIPVSVLIAILFVSAFTGISLYFNGELNDRNSKIALLNKQVANLTSQVSDLSSQVTNLTSPNLVPTLSTQEIPKFSQEYLGGPNYTIPFNFVQITGTVTNTGISTAFDVGLHVIGYDLNGTLIANITVPLGSGYFGTDNATDTYSTGVPQLGTLYSGQIANINENIVHEGAAYNWTVTPVWSNSP